MAGRCCCLRASALSHHIFRQLRSQNGSSRLQGDGIITKALQINQTKLTSLFYYVRVRLEARKNRSKLQSKDDSDLVSNMAKLGDSISRGQTTQPMYRPQGNGKDLNADAATIRKGKKQDTPSYGVNESELRSLFDHRRTQPEICTVVYLADRFRLKRSDVQLLLRHTGISGLTKPNPEVKGQMIAMRSFDSNPSI